MGVVKYHRVRIENNYDYNYLYLFWNKFLIPYFIYYDSSTKKNKRKRHDEKSSDTKFGLLCTVNISACGACTFKKIIRGRNLGQYTTLKKLED